MDDQRVSEPMNVMFMDTEGGSGNSICLLLRMKGCRVVQAVTTEEALNWVAIRAHLSAPMDLLVVDHFTLCRKTRRLLVELSRLRLTTPILLVNRLGETPAIEKLVRRMAPSCAFTLCEPETVFEALDRFFVADRAVPQGTSL